MKNFKSRKNFCLELDIRVPELVGVEPGHIILLGELLHVPGWGLGVHRLRTVQLGKDVGADGVARLPQPELLEQFNDLRVNVDRPYFTALGGIQVNTLLRRIAEVSSNRDCASLDVAVYDSTPLSLISPLRGFGRSTLSMGLMETTSAI